MNRKTNTKIVLDWCNNNLKVPSNQVYDDVLLVYLLEKFQLIDVRFYVITISSSKMYRVVSRSYVKCYFGIFIDNDFHARLLSHVLTQSCLENNPISVFVLPTKYNYT